MEGGTDLDLQVLEAPTSAAAAEASGSMGGAGERSQADSSAANTSANAESAADPTRGEVDQTKHSKVSQRRRSSSCGPRLPKSIINTKIIQQYPEPV